MKKTQKHWAKSKRVWGFALTVICKILPSILPQSTEVCNTIEPYAQGLFGVGVLMADAPLGSKDLK